MNNEEEIECPKCRKLTDDMFCQEHCEHDDVCTDERCCLNCGKDMTESMCAEAEMISDMKEDR